MTQSRINKAAQRFRFDRLGAVIPDHRVMSQQYLHPDTEKYTHGDRLFEVKAPGSPARSEFKARRTARRLAKRGEAGRIAAAIAAAIAAKS